MVKDLSSVREGYFSGKMVWIQGPGELRKIRWCFEFLKGCHVSEYEVQLISADTFSDQFNSRIAEDLLRGIRVFLINEVEQLSVKKRTRFLHALSSARRMFFAFGIRILLLTTRESELDSKILSCYPGVKCTILNLFDSNADERVHWVLELACNVTQKKVRRLSVPVADFLERLNPKLSDEMLLDVLICAVFNSSQGVLSMDDFFKSINPKKTPPDDCLTYCN